MLNLVGRAPVHIMANIPRSEALKVLNQEGLLLVLCSLVDNMPYVLAEAAVRPFPFHTLKCCQAACLTCNHISGRSPHALQYPRPSPLGSLILSTCMHGVIKDLPCHQRAYTKGQVLCSNSQLLLYR